jgi:subtilisin family serine protease
VVAVAATDEGNRRAGFSNTGRHVALSAPGTNILSTLPTKPSAYRGAAETEYAAWSGTSMAAPHVAAAAALILAADPTLTPAQVTARLRKTAARLPPMKRRSWTKEYGSGLLDLAAALS